ncbi:hypothetical protein BDU57DRAFT_516579, partial [Ampelomyces quisqualis]
MPSRNRARMRQVSFWWQQGVHDAAMLSTMVQVLSLACLSRLPPYALPRWTRCVPPSLRRSVTSRPCLGRCTPTLSRPGRSWLIEFCNLTQMHISWCHQGTEQQLHLPWSSISARIW